MANLDLVSVITPMYNAEKTIKETIESVINQTYQNWEMIIVDDKSSDNSVKIVESYLVKDSRIQLHKLESNIGTPYFARNYATDKSKGKFIAFLDSDDVWLPTKLEKQVNFMTENNYEIVYSHYERISADGVRSGRVITAPPKVGYKEIIKRNPIGCLTAIYNKNIVGKLYQINHKHEDYIMWIAVLERDFTAYLYPEVLALYRIGNNSVSKSKKEMAFVTWDIYRNVFKFSLVKSIRSFLCYSYFGIKNLLK